jgi:membrane protein required for colicin V production
VIAGIGAVDLAMLAVLLLSVVVGLVRGLTFEVLSLAGWVVAYFAAQWFAAELAPYLPIGEPGSLARHVAALALLFVGVLVAWTLLARLVRLLLHATPLSLIDRVGGGAFGLLRGAVLLLALATVVRVTPAAQSRFWQASVGAAWLQSAVHVIHPLLPAEVGPWLPTAIRD